MPVTTQARLAIAAAALGIAVFAMANIHLVTVAFQSQPDCVVLEGNLIPAKKTC